MSTLFWFICPTYSQTATCVPCTDKGLCVCVASDKRVVPRWPRYWKYNKGCVSVYVPDNHSRRASWSGSVVPRLTGYRITAEEVTTVLSPRMHISKRVHTHVFLGSRLTMSTLLFLFRQKWILGLGNLLIYLKLEPNQAWAVHNIIRVGSGYAIGNDQCPQYPYLFCRNILVMNFKGPINRI